MATNFPTGLDTLTNPAGSDHLNSPDHAGQHSDINDSVEALEAKVGINGSAVASSVDYKLSHDVQGGINSTGLISGGILSINNGDTTLFDLTAGTGLIVDNYTDPASPVITPISWSAKIEVLSPLLNTDATSYIAIDIDGVLHYKNTDFSAEERRDWIIIGWVDHPDQTELIFASTEPIYNAEIQAQLSDLTNAKGPFVISGVKYLPTGSSELMRTEGYVFDNNINYANNLKSPSIVSEAAEDPCQLLYFYRNNSGGWNNDIAATTVVDADHWDDGSGVLADVPADYWSIQIISFYAIPNWIGNDIQYGQAVYRSYREAAQHLEDEVVLNPYNYPADLYRTSMIVKQGATDLTDTSQAKFFNAGKFGLFSNGDSMVDSQAILSEDEYSLMNLRDFTGIITGGILSINADGHRIDVTAGISSYADYTDPTAPVVERLYWDVQTIDPELSAVVTRLWIGVERVSPGVGQFVFSNEFTELQKRTIAIIGRVWGTGTADIEGVGQYTTLAYGQINTMVDLIKAIGSINVDGNTFSANGANLLTDKTSGHSFRFSANALNQPMSPNYHTNATLTGISAYHYHYYNSGTTTLETAIDPEYYDNAGAKTIVPTGKFTVQRLYYFPISDVIDVSYGQAYYDTIELATAAATIEEWTMDNTNLANLYGSILRGYLVVKQGTTALNNVADAKFIAAANFGASGSSSSSGGQSNSVIINVREENTSSIIAGQVCYISGSDGSLITVGKADCDTSPKFRVRGLANSNIAQGETGTIVVSGSISADTRTSNTAVNPNSETWAAGDFLYLSNVPGGLTNIRPTSGRSVKIGYTVKGNSATDELVICLEMNPVWITGASGEDVILRLGDNAGANKVSIRDYANTEVAYINSDGNISATNLSGTNTGDNSSNTSSAPIAHVGAGGAAHADAIAAGAAGFLTGADKTKLNNTSGVNTGDETAARIATIITGAGAQTTPLDADEFPFYKIVGTVLSKVTWTNIKATLKTYMDTLYVPVARTVNSKALSSDITLTLASSDFANQGTTTQVLYGNATGNPSWGTPPAGWTVVTKTADQTKINNGTIAADTEIQFAVSASTKYQFECKIYYDTTNAADFKWRHTGPTSPTIVRIQRSNIIPGTTAFGGIGVDTAFSASDITVIGSGTDGGFIEFTGILHNGLNAGTLAFAWAQNSATNANTIVRAGSYIKYKVVA